MAACAPGDLCGLRIQHFGYSRGDLAQDHREQRFLIVEIRVEATHAEAGRLGQFAQGHGVETMAARSGPRCPADAAPIRDAPLRVLKLYRRAMTFSKFWPQPLLFHRS